MKKVWSSMKGLTSAAISIFVGIIVLVFIHNAAQEEAVQQSKKDAYNISSEFKEQIIKNETLLEGVRAFIISNPDVKTEQLIAYLNNLNTNYIVNFFYHNEQSPIYLEQVNKQFFVVPEDKEVLKQAKLLLKTTTIKVKTEFLENSFLLTSNINDKNKNNNEMIGFVLSKQYPFSTLPKQQTEAIYYEVFNNKNHALTYTSPYHKELNENEEMKTISTDVNVKWDNLNIIIRVYGRRLVGSFFLENKWIIPLIVSSSLYLLIMTFLYLLTAHNKSKLVASEMTKEMKHLGWHDSLTQLYNRYKIGQELDLKINLLEDKSQRIIVACIDLQGFKRVNDELGHTAGDLLLKEYANRLIKKVPGLFEGVARAGGDEFLLFLDANKLTTNIDDNNDFDKQLENLCNEFDSLINDPFIINEEIFAIKQKIGLSIYPEHGHNAEDLFKFAELAMYEAKNQQDFVFIYQSELAKKLTVINKMKNALALALKNNEFYLMYQPKVTVDINGLQKHCAEVLCRWKSPQFGNVSPDIFISLAEETGEIHRLGKWVMIEALKQMSTWRSDGLLMDLSINLSPKQFLNENLPYEFNAIAEQYGVNPINVSLEMTENSMITDKEQSQIILNKFSEYGFKISIDDFGKGHSSLSYLKDYPISEIKMDKGFIDDIIHNQFNQILVEGIILVSKKLGVDLVIEGVETEEQTKFLANMGCIKFQGYYFSKPLKPLDLERYVET